MSADESDEAAGDDVAQEFVDGMVDLVEDAEDAVEAARDESVDHELDRVSVESVPVGASAMMEIESQYDEWVVHEADDGAIGWKNTERDEFVMASTPEGVPDGYEYLPPGEDPPDDRDVVESPAGGTYIGPPGSGDGDDDSGGGGDGGSSVPDEGVVKTDSGAYVSADPDPERDVESFMEDDEVDALLEKTNSEPGEGFSVQRNLDTYNAADDDVWICGVTSVEVSPEEGMSKEDVVDFYEEYLEVLEQKEGVRIGGFHFEDGSEMSIDLSAALTDREEAVALGEELDQDSIFNPKTALGEGNWDEGLVDTGGDGDSPLNGASPEEVLETLNELDSITAQARGVIMKQGDETETETHEDDVFESDDGETLTRNAIVRSKVHGEDVERDGDAFVVNGTRYEPADDQ